MEVLFSDVRFHTLASMRTPLPDLKRLTVQSVTPAWDVRLRFSETRVSIVSTS